MNNLVTGIPQRVESGAALLGMTSWHLHPDMIVLQKSTEHIRQEDNLVANTGILTQIGVETARVSMDHCGYILLGSVFSTWHEFAPNGTKGMDWILKILEILERPQRHSRTDSSTLLRIKKLKDKSSWIGQLLSAAEQYKYTDDIEQGIARKLIGLGQRHSHFVCYSSDHPSPVFGLSEIPLLFLLLSNLEPRVAYLRDFAKELELSNEHGVIHYRHTEDGITVDEYTTLDTVKRDLWAEGTGYIPVASRREPPYKCKGTCLRPEKSALASAKPVKPGFSCWNIGGCSIACHDWKKVPHETCGSLHGGLLTKRLKLFQSMGEKCLPVHISTDISDSRYSSVDFGTGSDFQSSLIEICRDKGSKKSKNMVHLQYWVGDHTTAEIVKIGDIIGDERKDKRPGQGTKQIGEFLSTRSLKAMFNGADFDHFRFTEWFASTLRSKGYERYVKSLRACASAAEIYTRLPDATIESFKEVFAISSGNSIFVASPLLCDPYEQPTEVEIQRVPGNIGYPGLSLLIPPPDPKILKPGVENCGCEMPLQSLDRNKDGHIIDRPKDIVCGTEYSRMFEEDDLVAADNWDEILTLNGGSLSVVRATGNWLTRLAATVINVQAQRSTILVPKDVCWTCLKEHLQRKDLGGGHEKVLIA
ncbi:hypothetical protein BHYA_0061g00280 [Botrytis hyacinthi]|uniref:Uncharacterized protein n=1 Tax=Botrytis hyacinthi TaxID=278943 RepID=A0A4Z1GVK6_9HELO|nr:hypothetical protein BHYA_0061g00280 [Botrytis hyacinthi]